MNDDADHLEFGESGEAPDRASRYDHQGGGYDDQDEDTRHWPVGCPAFRGSGMVTWPTQRCLRLWLRSFIIRDSGRTCRTDCSC